MGHSDLQVVRWKLFIEISLLYKKGKKRTQFIFAKTPSFKFESLNIFTDSTNVFLVWVFSDLDEVGKKVQ